MQLIAMETNQPETSFVLASREADFRVVYYTPRTRIPFAGHPTIATAFLLALDGAIPPGRPALVTFQFDIGVLPVEVHFSAAGRPERVVMSQAAPVFGARENAAEVAACLGLPASDLRAEPGPQVVSTGVPFLLAVARDLDVLSAVQMDRPRLRGLLSRAGVSCVFLFSLRGFEPGADTHARLIDPDGVMEDPFTGSAAGCMGAYIVRYALKSGPILHIEQGHLVGRPGRGELEVVGKPDGITGIRLSGSAVKTTEGEILL